MTRDGRLRDSRERQLAVDLLKMPRGPPPAGYYAQREKEASFDPFPNLPYNSRQWLPED